MNNYNYYGTNREITAINMKNGNVYKARSLNDGAHIAFDRNIVANTVSQIGRCLTSPTIIVREQVKRIQDNPFQNMGRRRDIKALPKHMQNILKTLR